MIVTHCGTSYECAVAVKCEDDKYIKLYDADGVEIAAFYNISDFTEYSISNGSFVAPCDCDTPIIVSTYAVRGRTITPDAWLFADDRWVYEIENPLISANTTTCNVFLLFAQGTNLKYTATQETGKITLSTLSVPESNVVIESIQITRP